MDRVIKLIELKCNVDDMTGEAISFAIERFYELGATDAYTIPIGMKKSRPGILINVCCEEQKKDALIDAIFKYTTTIGVREYSLFGHSLDRRIETLDTDLGTVRYKVSEGHGVEKVKFEYDDLAMIAEENGITLDEAIRRLKAQN